MPLSPEDIAYLRAAAARDGYNPDHALKVFDHESSFRPNVWGGTGNKYFGLFQAGPSERKDYGVDTVHPSARNQIDAFGRFLHGRGFKPGMGLEDMYSTVLAGSPGHYNRSDGAGTVAQHVARMQGGGAPSLKTGAPSSGIDPAALAALGYADTQPSGLPAKQDPIGDMLSSSEPQENPIAGLLTQLAEQDKQAQEEAQAKQEALQRQLMDFHNARHGLAVQGLLGG